MGQHLGKNSSENGDLNKNVPNQFQSVDWKAVQLLWQCFIKGDSPDFIMDKNELVALFESWQTEGKSLYESDPDSWFAKGNKIERADIQAVLPHFIHKIEHSNEESNENNGSTDNNQDDEDGRGNDVSEKEYVDVMEIIFTVLILSKGTTQQKLELMFKCANFEDDLDTLSKDDILLPLKAFVTSAFTIYNLVMVEDEIIESMCEHLYQSVCSIDLSKKSKNGATPRSNSSGSSKHGEFKSNTAPQEMFEFIIERLLAWSNTEPVIESWLSPATLRCNRDKNQEEENNEDDHDMEGDPEIHGIPQREGKDTLAMDPDFRSSIDGDDPLLQNTTEGDMFMAVRPYVGTVKRLKPTPLEDQVFVASKKSRKSAKKPTGANGTDEAPHASLTLQYVHGYAGQKSRNNVFYLKHETMGSGPSSAIVYHVAGVGIVRSTDSKNAKQRYAFHHTDDILCMALGEDCPQSGKYNDVVATGEVGKKPKICVWQPNVNMDLLVSLRGFHQGGVTQLCFSREKKDDDGRTNKYLISLGLDEYHSVAVYDWKKNELMYNARTHKSTVLSLNACPQVDWSNNHDVLFCTAGIQHLLFWKKKGRGIICKRGTFGISRSKSKKKSKIIILCMDWFSDGTLLCGTSNGQILMWSKGIFKRDEKKPAFNVPDLGSQENHTPTVWRKKKSAINCLKVFKRITKRRLDKRPFDDQFDTAKGDTAEEFVITGGSDGRVILFSNNREVGGVEIATYSAGDTLKHPNRHMLELYQYTSMSRKKNNAKLRECILDCHIRAICMSESALNAWVSGEGGVQSESDIKKSGQPKIVVGTYGSDIIEFALPIKAFVKTPAKEGSDDSGQHFDDCTIVNVLARGHNKDELWGLATHPLPNSQMFATVGDDATLRLWSSKKGHEEMMGIQRLVIGKDKVMARAVAWSLDGTKIVVGIGGRMGRRTVGTKSKHDGEIYIFRLNQKDNSEFFGSLSSKYTEQLFESEPPTNLSRGVSLRPHPKGWISDIKFSNQALAVAAHDNQIYLYNAQTFTLRCRCKGHSGSVLHIDFSQDGRVLQSTCNSYELLFWDVNSGKQITHASSLRDQKWSSFTCPLGWPVQGIWPKSADGTDINAVDLYQSNDDVQLIKNKLCNQYVGLLATVDDFGKVKLFNSPAEEAGAACIEYRGHSAHVTNCRFTSKPEMGKKPLTYLLTTGGEDRAIMQWKLDVDDVNHEEEEVSGSEMDIMNEGWTPRSTAETEQHQPVVYDPLDAAFEFGSAGAGDEFMAVKPWIGAIKAPTNPPPPVPNISPETDLELKWVNGFNGFSTRNAVHYDSEGALHYSAATLNVRTALGEGQQPLPGVSNSEGESKGDDHIKYSPKQYCQTYNEDHRDDVLCVAMSEDNKVAASGAMGKKPRIVVYHASGPEQMKTINVLSGFHKRSVSSLAFCKDLLASVGEDESHSVAVYNWKTGTLVASAKGEKQKVFGICFNEDGTRLAQCGVNHIRFWDLKGRNLAPKKGLLKGHGKIQPFLSVCHVGVNRPDSDQFIFGGTTGELYVFEGRECIGTITDSTAEVIKRKTKKGTRVMRHAHNGGINALMFCKMWDNRVVPGTKTDKLNNKKYTNVIVSGGRSGWVKVWDAALVLDRDALDRSRNAERDTSGTYTTQKCWCNLDHGDGPNSKQNNSKRLKHYKHCWMNNVDFDNKLKSEKCLSNIHCKPLAKFNVAGMGTALGNPKLVWQIRSVTCLSQPDETKPQRLAIGTRGAQIWEYNLQDLAEGPGPEALPYNTGEILHQVQDTRKRKYEEQIIVVVEPAPLVQGHWKDEVWGLAMHPQNPDIYATVGDDKTLRVWNIKEKRVMGQTNLDGMARCVALSPDASMIAVGLGGSVGRGKDKMDGWVYIYDGETVLSGFEELEQAQTMHHAKGWVSDIKFSPDGASLAVGSHDNKIYIYDIFPPANELVGEENKSKEQKTDKIKYCGPSLNIPNPLAGYAKSAMKGRSVRLRGICKGHSSYITHLDFSADSKWLQTTCGAYELLFWDVRSPTPGAPYTKAKPQRIRQQGNATAMRDVDWHTWTCTLGWPVQGIWPKCADGTDINAADLNGSPSMNDKSKKKKTLITADDSGKLKMFRWPCIEKGSPFSVESGHASHVTNVRWNSNSKWVVSTGGNDRCVFQWEMIKEEEVDESVHEMDGDHPEDLMMEQFASIGGGDEFMAVKPWKGQIAAPTKPMTSNPMVPKIDVELEWIFGYRAQDVPGCRAHDNMRYSASGDIIYHSAAVGIVLNDKSDDLGEQEGGGHQRNPYSQRFFREHDDDILCMAIDPKGRYVATGQTQSSKSRKMKPNVKIWDAESCRPICTLGKFHKRSVTSVAFSADGKWCGTVGGDNNHSVALWGSRNGQWSDGKLITTCRGDPGNTFFLSFAGDTNGKFNFVTGGVRHMRFWNVTGHTMKSKKCILGQNVPPTKAKTIFLTAIGLGRGYFVAGMHSGHIYLFEGNRLKAFADAHKSGTGGKTGCQTLHLKTDPTRKQDAESVQFVSGGSDGQIILWEFKFPKKGSEPRLEEIRNSRFNISSITPRPKNHCIKSVCWDGSLQTILIGTQGSEAYSIGTEGNKINKDKVKLLFSGHYQDEVWGLAPHPVRPSVVATCGDDMTLRVWRTDQDDHQCLAVGELLGMSRAVSWKPDGQWLIVGLGGRVGRKNITSGRKKKRKNKNNKKSKKGRQEEEEQNYDGHFMIFEVKQELYESSVSNYEMLTPYLDKPQSLHGDRPNNWICDVKFSPNGEYVAFCAHDGRVYLYSTTNMTSKISGKSSRGMSGPESKKLECLAIYGSGSSAVTHIDWAQHPKNPRIFYIQTNDLSYEILRYEFNYAEYDRQKDKMPINAASKKAIKKKNVTHLSDVRDLNWDTYTAPLGWGVQGIWPSGVDGSDINAVDRSRNYEYVASADDFGDVKIFNYPCTNTGASSKVANGHSSHVMNVRFNSDSTALYSVGGNDRSVFKWSIKPKK